MKKAYDSERIAGCIPCEPLDGERRVAYLRPGQLLTALNECPVAYVPLGTLEWHGRHNPLGCDMIKAESVCAAAARQSGGVVTPPLFLSSDVHRDKGSGLGLGMDATAGFVLPGSFYYTPPALFQEILTTVCENLLSRGVRLVVIVSGHNPTIQRNLVEDVCYRFMTPDGLEPVIMRMEYDAADDPSLQLERVSDHAAGYETSMMLHLTDRVRMNANDGLTPRDLGVSGEIPFDEATAAFGGRCFESEVRGLAADVLQHLKSLGNG